MQRRAFTVEEVDALIPHLEAVLSEVREELSQLQARREKLQVLDVLWGECVEDPSNPDHEELIAHRTRVRQAAERVERLIKEEVLSRGIRFPQGGLEHGLLDFPTTYRGRWIYLCWRSGEPRVMAWHELDGGFRGRRALTSDQARAMGRGPGPDDV